MLLVGFSSTVHLRVLEYSDLELYECSLKLLADWEIDLLLRQVPGWYLG